MKTFFAKYYTAIAYIINTALLLWLFYYESISWISEMGPILFLAVFNLIIFCVVIYRKSSLFKPRRKIKEKHQFDYVSGEYNFEVINFQGIKRIQVDLPLSSPWIFLTGDNGYGKTNILQALARVLSTADDNRIYDAIKPFFDNTRISITIDGHTNTIPQKKLALYKMTYRIMGYGAGRLDMGSDRSTKEYKPASSLFESQVLLRNIEREGLSRWYFKRNDKHKFNDCVDIFKQLMPTLHEIVVDDNSNVWYIESADSGVPLPKVQFRDLAAGYQNIISMVGDIILNLNMPRSKFEESNIDDNMNAIVLIDEIELYLHPKWQKKLPELLTKLFPNILFIASTHSPIPLLGAPKGSAFFLVNRSFEDGITMNRLDEKIYIDELLPNTILTSPIFGMEDILSTNFSGEKQPRTENSYQDVIINNEIDKKINNYMNDKKEKELIERFRMRRRK